ncbi:MAG: DUF488 family protein [Pseudonocardiaceae bacterium]
MAHALLTLGHGTASREQLLELLDGAGVEELVDVRTAPGSRRNPHVARGELARWLPEHGVSYRWERRLGGWRRAPAGSPDTGLRNRSFTGYAAHMRTPEYRTAVDEVLAAGGPTAVLCSEAVWWRCHRRMIADFVVLVRGVPVRHLMHDGREQDHHPTDVARLTGDGLLVYDGGQEPLADLPEPQR